MNFTYNSNMLSGGTKIRRQKFGISSLLFLSFVGLAFMVAGNFIDTNLAIAPSWSRTSGTITSISTRIDDGSKLYAPIVSYTVDNKTYHTTSNFQSSLAPSIGDTREIAYNPNQPEESKLVEKGMGALLPWILSVIGGSLAILAIILFVRSGRRSRLIQALQSSGQKLTGIITDIQPTAGNNGAFKIVVSATDLSGTVRNYLSDTLGGFAGLSMADFRNNPIPIDVYIDPTDPDRYYVDISDIPNLTPERIQQLIQSAIKPQPATPVATTPPTMPDQPTASLPPLSPQQTPTGTSAGQPPQPPAA